MLLPNLYLTALVYSSWPQLCKLAICSTVLTTLATASFLPSFLAWLKEATPKQKPLKAITKSQQKPAKANQSRWKPEATKSQRMPEKAATNRQKPTKAKKSQQKSPQTVEKI